MKDISVISSKVSSVKVFHEKDYEFCTGLDCMRRINLKILYRSNDIDKYSPYIYVHDVKFLSFYGKCDGALKSVESLVQDNELISIIKTLSGITCQGKVTSCSDQLAWALTRVYLDVWNMCQESI